MTPRTRLLLLLSLLSLPAAAQEASLWLSGDLHVHSDHSSDGSAPRQGSDDRLPGNVGIQDQIGIAVLQQLDFLPLTDHRTYSQHYSPDWQSPDLILIPGEEANGSPHATVHGAVDTVVQGSNRADTAEYLNLQQSIWMAKSQGAVWITAHPDDGEVNEDGSPNLRASAQGVDSVEVWNRASDVETEIDYAENRWNAGWRFGINGASDNHFRELWAIAGPGSPRTEVQAVNRSERAILQGLQAARTRIRADLTAPILELRADVDGDGEFETGIGDERVVAPGTVARLRLTVRQGVGTSVRLYRAPGRAAGPWQEVTPLLDEQSYTFSLPMDQNPGWIRAEARGLGLPAGLNTNDVPLSLIPAPTELPDQLRAITAPIFYGPRLAEAQPETPLPVDLGAREGGSERVLGRRGEFLGFPDIARSRRAWQMVAERHEPGATRIVYRRQFEDGRRGPEQVLSGDSASARFPRVAARGNTVWVVWQDERAGQQPRRPAILARQSLDEGRSWGEIQTIRALAGRAERPDVLIDAAGMPVFAWQEIQADQPFDIWVREGVAGEPRNLSRPGKTVMTPLPFDTRSARYPASVGPSLALAADGRLALAWQDNREDVDPLWTGRFPDGEGSDPDDWQIQLVLRAADGSWGAIETVGSADRSDQHPSLAFAADGRLVLAWDRRPLQAAGVNLEIASASRSPEGVWSAPEPLSQTPEAMAVQVRLAPAARGGVQAVWADGASADWRWRLVSRRQDRRGVWGAPQRLMEAGNQLWPALEQGVVVAASTRFARRLQRDPTQTIQRQPLPE
ncbi:MAG TPA: CehA/McbA family metallohydrolase [Nevskiaceae bacterium]|nr:CehA/McbA family metallohydrolase [Nevskiaceae bacterium]